MVGGETNRSYEMMVRFVIGILCVPAILSRGAGFVSAVEGN